MPADFDGIIKFVSFVGVPGAFMLGVLYLMARVTSWSAPRIDSIIQRHVVFLDSLQSSVKEMTESLREIRDTQRQSVCRWTGEDAKP